ncbi:hypothetical protein C8Q79DRAFT_330221 [Trametes meyenii]|nr:hypothetical protein C8Q79DRAFT_330221 [Trametes meyenii]
MNAEDGWLSWRHAGHRYEVLDAVGDAQSAGGVGNGSATTSLGLPKPAWTRLWTSFWPLPVLGISYFAHVRYRRYSPRRLPTLTSMKLRELYAFHAVTAVFSGLSDEFEDEVLDDKDMSLLETVARAIRGRIEARDHLDELVDAQLDEGLRQDLEAIRTRKFLSSSFTLLPTFDPLGMYDHGRLSEKIAWWHNHIWSDKDTWSRVAIRWALIYGVKNMSPDDFDFVVTHIANTCCHVEGTFSYVDYGSKASIPFGICTPFAMLARWLGPPLLYLPLNGLQRLFWWGVMYPDIGQKYQHYAYLRHFPNKHAVAERIRSAHGTWGLQKYFFKRYT